MCPVKSLLSNLYNWYVQEMTKQAYRGLSWQRPFDDYPVNVTTDREE